MTDENDKRKPHKLDADKHPVKEKREAKSAQGQPSGSAESTGGSREGNIGHQANRYGSQGNR